MQSLSTRQNNYELAYDNQIIKRLPIIIRVDGKNFHRLTKNLKKPYCHSMAALMADTMLIAIKYIEGAVFGYQQSDEITFVLRNDQTLESEPWFGNRIQKITSIAASLTTYEFNKLYHSMLDKPDLFGQAIFDARVFAVPTLSEVVNNLIFRQQDCIRNAITGASQVELGKVYGMKTAIKMIYEKSGLERIDLLKDNCDINFEEYYPASFRHGVAAYKALKFYEVEGDQVPRQKWVLDNDLPIFSKDRSFVLDIINSGRDIFRADRDITEESI